MTGKKIWTEFFSSSMDYALAKSDHLLRRIFLTQSHCLIWIFLYFERMTQLSSKSNICIFSSILHYTHCYSSSLTLIMRTDIHIERLSLKNTLKSNEEIKLSRKMYLSNNSSKVIVLWSFLMTFMPLSKK